MESTLLKLSLILFLLHISISSCVDGRATLLFVDQTDNSPTGLKKQIESIRIGSHQTSWLEWARSRAGLEADGIVQAVKHHFAGASWWLSREPRQRNIPATLSKRNIEFDQPTFVFVINNGGNSLDGLLAATFLWLEGIQIVGFHSRGFRNDEKISRRKLDDEALANEFEKEILKVLNLATEETLNLKPLIFQELQKRVIKDALTAKQKIADDEAYYGKLGETIFEIAMTNCKGLITTLNDMDIKKSILHVISLKSAREKAGHIADGYVTSLLSMLKKLGVEIYEEPVSTTQKETEDREKAEDYFDRYTNIVGAFDALNGAGKQHTAIFAKSYGGLALLKYLKSGMNRSNNVIIIGVDMASFEDSLYVTDGNLEKLNETIKDNKLIVQLKADRDERVVKSDIVVTINAYRKEKIPLMENAVYYLVIPKPVQDLFDLFAIKNANSLNFTLPISSLNQRRPGFLQMVKGNTLTEICTRTSTNLLHITKTLPVFFQKCTESYTL